MDVTTPTESFAMLPLHDARAPTSNVPARPERPARHYSPEDTRCISVSRDLDFVDSGMLSQLDRFNLCGKVLSQEPFIVGRGSFSDVFRGFCQIEERDSVMAAMKRLRLHVNAAECKGVSSAIVLHEVIMTADGPEPTALREGDLRMVETQPPKHIAIPGLRL